MGQHKKGEYKVPFVPVLPWLSVLACAFLMSRLQKATWIVFLITIVLGLAIYFFYGYQHSHLAKKEK